MALIDEVYLHISAGRGGDGVERWLHEKFREFGGPSGGDGGKGGDVVFLGVRDINALSRYRHLKKMAAENGQDGMKDSLHGQNGADLIIKVPVPSRITVSDGEVFTIEKEGEQHTLLLGGFGGYGNEHFKSSTNVSPREWTPGKEGKEADVFIELELTADVGLIGLPNAGKSSLLNTLTHARSKIGAYAFTTLEPHLGDMHGVILADIPGLIEGASEGRGLGIKFLRHIRRTRMLAHLVSVENDDVWAAFEAVRNELEAFDKDLVKKPTLIVLSKIDEVSEEVWRSKAAIFEKKGFEVTPMSVLDDKRIKAFRDLLTDRVRALL